MDVKRCGTIREVLIHKSGRSDGDRIAKGVDISPVGILLDGFRASMKRRSTRNLMSQ